MIIIAEACASEPIHVNGQPLYCARELASDNEKSLAIQRLLTQEPVAWFLKLHEKLCHHLHSLDPFVLVTDWTDPCELVGLRLETNLGVQDYPELCFLAFYTDWENLSNSGIAEIFGHELSHLWLHRMGYDPSLSKSNRFHTCTAITDPCLAFSEGLAECLEIVSADRCGTQSSTAIYDHGYDVQSWLCLRDSALRINAVKNNRFLYLTADPDQADFDTYEHLHIAHITSSAFMPERLKNGSQAVSSEGLIASFFYQMYRCEEIRETRANQAVCRSFDTACEELDSDMNVYIKTLYAISHMDLKKETLFTEFISAYAACFPAEREILFSLFGLVTNFVTMDKRAANLFGSCYRIGRRGIPSDFTDILSQARALKKECLEDLLSGARLPDAAVYPGIWIEADKEIPPVPWDPDKKVPLKFDINAATPIDYFGLNGLTYAQCCQLATLREELGGFTSLAHFWETVNKVRNGIG